MINMEEHPICVRKMHVRMIYMLILEPFPCRGNKPRNFDDHKKEIMEKDLLGNCLRKF